MSNKIAIVRRGRGNTGSSPAHHAATCKVCQHPAKADIQHKYMAGASSYELGERYRLSACSIQRHGRYFNLIGSGARDVEQGLSLFLSRNLEKLLGVPFFSPEVFLKVVAVLATLSEKYIKRGPYDAETRRDMHLFQEALDKFVGDHAKLERVR